MSDLPFEDVYSQSEEYGSMFKKKNPGSTSKIGTSEKASLISKPSFFTKNKASEAKKNVSKKTEDSNMNQGLVETKSARDKKATQKTTERIAKMGSKESKAELKKQAKEKEKKKLKDAKDKEIVDQKKAIRANVAVSINKAKEISKARTEDKEREKASVELIEEKKKAQLLIKKEVSSQYVGDVDVTDKSWGDARTVNPAAHRQFLKNVGFDESRDKEYFNYSCPNDADKILTKYIIQQWNGQEYLKDEIYKTFVEEVLKGDVKDGPGLLLSYAKNRMATSFSGNAEVIRLTKYLYITSPWAPTLRTSLNGMSVYSSDNSNTTKVIMTHTQLSLLANSFILKEEEKVLTFVSSRVALDERVGQIAEYMSYMELDSEVKSYIEDCVVAYEKEKSDYNRKIPKVPFDDAVQLQQLENFKNLLGELYKRETVNGPFYFDHTHKIVSVNDIPTESKQALNNILKTSNPTKDLFTLELKSISPIVSMSPFDVHTLTYPGFKVQSLSLSYSRADPPILLQSNIPDMKLTVDDILSEADTENLLYNPICEINGRKVVSHQDVARILMETQTIIPQSISFVKNKNNGAEEGFFFGNIGKKLISLHIPAGGVCFTILRIYFQHYEYYEASDERFKKLLFAIRQLLPAFRENDINKTKTIEDFLDKMKNDFEVRKPEITPVVEKKNEEKRLELLKEETDVPFPGIRFQLKYKSLHDMNKTNKSSFGIRESQNILTNDNLNKVNSDSVLSTSTVRDDVKNTQYNEAGTIDSKNIKIEAKKTVESLSG